jgi:hypothetical protein
VDERIALFVLHTVAESGGDLNRCLKGVDGAVLFVAFVEAQREKCVLDTQDCWWWRSVPCLTETYRKKAMPGSLTLDYLLFVDSTVSRCVVKRGDTGDPAVMSND